MSTEQFRTAWNELRPAQKQIAEWTNGPILVLAGPGSGKTRVLTCRIAQLLHSTHTENFRVLALTFTTKAADEMRTRLESFYPGQDARLFIGTFHSFCADVLRQHGNHLGIQPNFNIYSQDADLNAVLSDAVDRIREQSSVISDLDKKTLPVIQRMKANLVFPKKLLGIFRDPQMDERMSHVYPAYEDELRRRNALDFNSLILRTYELLTTFPALAKRFRTVYPYICIDEFQDTNVAQYRLIRALTQDQHKNVFVVADDDQIIYQWNGASFKRLEDFRNDYAPAVAQLPDNFRCPPEIVALANSLIRFNSMRTPDKQPLSAVRKGGIDGTVRLFPSHEDSAAEAEAVANDIRDLHQEELGTVVVLARNRKLLQGVQEALVQQNISAVISQRKDDFESAPFIWLHSLLKLANDRQNRQCIESICGTFGQMTGVEVDPEDVIAEADAANRDWLQYWIKAVRRRTLDSSTQEVISSASRNLVEGRDLAAFDAAADKWFASLIANGKTFWGYEEERVVWRELLAEISKALGEDQTLESVLQELQMRSKDPTPKPNTVVLMTIHGSKGKEFDHVYLVGLVENELPSFQSKKNGDHSPEMEEERRNCFVAITRTIKTLTMTYAERYRGWPKEPSRFLFEMGLLKHNLEN